MKNRVRIALVALAPALFSVAPSTAASERKALNRSIYVPVEFVLCEHLSDAVFYQDDVLTSAMPAKRIFQFTYYPDLKRILPEAVQVRVEGSYLEGGESFLARLAVTADGVHTARRVKDFGTEESVRRQLHKVDVRLEPRTLKLECSRFCSKHGTVVAGGTNQ
jgi:hypothetical protein